MTHVIEKRPFIGLFLLFLFYNSCLIGSGYNPKISSIEIYGNSNTLDYILEREIQHPLFSSLDSSLAEADRNRLENLGIFSDVSWKAIPLQDRTAILKFSVIESIQKTPPGAFPIYEEETGWSLTGVWIIQNFRGRNQTLQMGGSIGGKDTYGFNFSDPWMFGNHVSFSISMGRSLFNHNFLERSIDVHSLSLSFGKWFGHHIKTSAGFELEEKSFFNESVSESYFYFAPDVSVKYDTRDIYWNPSKGVLFKQFLYNAIGLGSSDLSYTIWNQSYSLYVKLNKSDKNLILAINGSIKRKLGDKQEVWLNYFGDSNTVRGWGLPNQKLYTSGNESFRFGHESIKGSIELRKDIIPKYLTKYGTEFGLGFIAFYDIGIISDNWDTIFSIKPMSGTGFGIRIPVPMVDVLRFDYGWGFRNGEWSSGAFHWGIQQTF
ncbi:MAG: BamA/TamA family outer membrane protein [Candidatus Marinimicrobia bacterium]|nr:BamA/TamA family outer membrane protein [Candidatus Neomarinimicrobiota bacterium]